MATKLIGANSNSFFREFEGIEYRGWNTGDRIQETGDKYRRQENSGFRRFPVPYRGHPIFYLLSSVSGSRLLYSVSCLPYSVFFIDLYSEKVNLVHHFREHDGP